VNLDDMGMNMSSSNGYEYGNVPGNNRRMKKISGKYRNEKPKRYNGSELSDIVIQLCHVKASPTQPFWQDQ
jgi:hypothetical protein